MPKSGGMKMNDIKKIFDLCLKAGLGPCMIAGALNKQVDDSCAAKTKHRLEDKLRPKLHLGRRIGERRSIKR